MCDTFKLNMVLDENVKTSLFKAENQFHIRTPFLSESVTLNTCLEMSSRHIFVSVWSSDALRHGNQSAKMHYHATFLIALMLSNYLDVLLCLQIHIY